jgi:hypothetical protein
MLNFELLVFSVECLMQVRRTLPTENIPRPREEEVAAGDSNTYKSVTFDVSPDDGESDLEI